jgi:nitrogen fixation protein FixH
MSAGRGRGSDRHRPGQRNHVAARLSDRSPRHSRRGEGPVRRADLGRRTGHDKPRASRYDLQREGRLRWLNLPDARLCDHRRGLCRDHRGERASGRQGVSTFPGLEVENSYVASQGFNERKAAQDALGWVMTPTYEAGRIKLAFTDRRQTGAVQDLKVLIGRTTEAGDDVWPDFAGRRGLCRRCRPGHGKWMLKVTALSADGTLFEQRSDLFVKG